jgi:hypothetical protein
MLRIVRFGKHFSFHLQGEHVVVGRFWKPWQAVGGEWDVTVLIGGAEEQAAIKLLRMPCHYLICVHGVALTHRDSFTFYQCMYM